MSPEAIATVVSSALGIVAAVAPGVLAAITGRATDEEAIAHAVAAVHSIRKSPAETAIENRR